MARSGREKIFSGRLFDVFRGNKDLPDGRKAYFEEVEHSGAALVVPFFGKKVVFIRQYRGVIGKYIWELPAGTIDPGETPRACAKREVTEETGYRVSAVKKLGMIYTTPGFCTEKIHIFTAECDRRVPAERDADEVISVRHMSVNEIRSLFKKGKIVDAKTISAMAMAGIL